MMTKKIVISIFILLFILIFQNKVHAFTIVLDPGHGGKDTGAINGELIESKITHKIGNYLKSYLEKYQNVKVLMTNNGIENTTLFEDAMVARDNKADILVSLHINSSFDSSAYGAEIFITANKTCDKYNKNCMELANMILENLGKLGIASRGVTDNKFCSDVTDVYSDGTRADWMGIIRYAMRGTMIDKGVVSIIKDGKKIEVPASTSAIVEKGEGIPSILIEHCFIKGSDVKFLDTDEKIKKLAEADGKALVDYYGLKLKNTATPTPTTDNSNIKVDDENNIVTLTPQANITDIQKTLGIKEITLLDKNDKKTENIATGGKIKTTNKTYTIIKLGDVDGDGKIKAKDALSVLKHSMGVELLDGIYLKAAEVGGQKTIKAKDALSILKCSMGIAELSI